jgi:inner membrane protein
MMSPTHALVGLAIGSVLTPRAHSPNYVLAGALCAVVPDVDLLAPYLGGDGDLHRRFTHSLMFGGLLGIACGAAGAILRRSPGQYIRLGAIVAMSALSHALLDMLTTYRLGAALLSPFSASRYASPWQPIDSLTSEGLWVALPAVVVLLSVLRLRRIQLVTLTREAPATLQLR